MFHREKHGVGSSCTAQVAHTVCFPEHLLSKSLNLVRQLGYYMLEHITIIFLQVVISIDSVLCDEVISTGIEYTRAPAGERPARRGAGAGPPRPPCSCMPYMFAMYVRTVLCAPICIHLLQYSFLRLYRTGRAADLGQANSAGTPRSRRRTTFGPVFAGCLPGAAARAKENGHSVQL